MAYYMHKRTKELVQVTIPADPGLGVDVVEYKDPVTGEAICVSKELFDGCHDPVPFVDQMEDDIEALVTQTFASNATTGA